MRCFARYAVAGVLAVAAAAAAAPPKYVATLIPPVLNGHFNEPTAINAAGQVAGTSNTQPGNWPHAFLFSGGFVFALGTPNGMYGSAANSVNRHGQVVGYAWQGYLFSGAWTPVGALGAAPESTAWGINNAGQVVGRSRIAGPMLEHGYLLEAGVMYDLNNNLLTDLQGREIVNAVAINDSGQIAATACNVGFTNCVAVRLDPYLPGPGTVAADPYGGISVTGGTYTGGTLTLTQPTAEIQLGPNANVAQALGISFAGLNFAPGTKVAIRAGAPGQAVILRNAGPNATTIAGSIVAAGLAGGVPAPQLLIVNDKGIAVGAEGSIAAPSGLTLSALAIPNYNLGAGVVNQGIVDGGPNLTLQGSMVNGRGAYKGNATRITTFGNVNNPVHGLHYLANGLRLVPSSGSAVAVTLNGYGAAPQVFNVRVEGDAMVSMPSAWPPGSPEPVNNAPVLPGQFRPAAVPDPAYGGGSLIVQATGALVLDGGVSNDFVFPGSLVLVAGDVLDFNGVTVDNGWTTGGQAWQGMFFEAPVITSSNGPIAAYASDNNWINFNVKPDVGVRAFQLKRVTGGAAQFATADSVAPHLNTYSTQVEIAANGGCWTCTVNPDPVNMY